MYSFTVSSQDCQQDVVVTCIQPILPVLQDLVSGLETGNINLPALANGCPDYRIYKNCTSPECLPPLFRDVDQLLLGAFSYICDDVFSDIQRYRQCLGNFNLNADFKECGIRANDIAASDRDPCRYYDEFETCLDDVTRTRCGMDQARVIRGYLSVANAQQKRDLQCETPPPVDQGETTVSQTASPPTFPVRCWDCNSGMSRDQNPLCPVSGNLTTDLLTSVMCDDACFVKTARWNKHIIYRGCSKGHYLPEDLERTGCIENENEGVVWCFCSTEKCNTQDMTSFLDERE
ncbi:uncharacterized protein LOC124253617 [Haliotis rubra]|uniref:uncharacterized protein LOC124253617 n=1 Tax=Haliotis rubra TaxID=36100 RepID=UPI001EE566FD|nr:uncharacterized protein LOC124253617 [Haliotis rubra]